MKRVVGLVLLLGLWIGSFMKAADHKTMSLLQQSIRSGSAERLAAYFDTSLELMIDSEEVAFSSVPATQAELILKAFFRRNPPQSFQYVQQGELGHRRYRTGTYHTNDHTFQVYLILQETDNQDYLIQSLQFRQVD